MGTSPTIGDAARLLLLAAIWGGSYLFLRVAAPAFGPAPLITLRVLLGGLTLLAWAGPATVAPALRREWPRLLVLGGINAAIPFTLIAFAELRLTASLAAILNSTTPLFAALLARALGREPLTGERIAGLTLGVAGVAVLVGWSPLAFNPLILLSIAATLLASLAYAVGALYASTLQARLPRSALMVGQQFGAAAVLLPLGLATAPAAAPTPAAMAALLALGIVCTALAYLLYFGLLASVGPTRTISVTFLIPIFGVLWGALFLREAVGPGVAVGLATVLAGVALVGGLGGRALRVARTRRAAGA